MQLEFLKTVKPNRILQILSKPRVYDFANHRKFGFAHIKFHSE